MSDPAESGPFCQHWGDPSDCDHLCLRCKHRCGRHGSGPCSEDGCDCPGLVWKDNYGEVLDASKLNGL